MATNITVEIGFIKLARSLLDAQKEAALSPTPRARQKAEQLRTLFIAKLSTYEKQVAGMESAADPSSGAAQLFDIKKVN